MYGWSDRDVGQDGECVKCGVAWRACGQVDTNYPMNRKEWADEASLNSSASYGQVLGDYSQLLRLGS
jgi:hypothetical protein